MGLWPLPYIMSVPTVVIVPGLRDYVADHWQTLLDFELAKTRAVHTVSPLGREDLSCGRRVAAIQNVVGRLKGAITFVAHSGGVIALAHWASQYRRPGIAGAVLATPADLETPLPAGYPAIGDLQNGGWLPIPRARLNFPSLIAASTNDPLAAFARVEQLARDWGSDLISLGAVGHLNPGSGFGVWPLATSLISQFDGAEA